MENMNKNRAVLRASFTKLANELEKLYKEAEADPHAIDVAWEMTKQKYEALEVADNEIYSLLLEDQTVTEAILMNEMDLVDGYTKRFTKLRLQYKSSRLDTEDVATRLSSTREVDQNSVAGSSANGNSISGKRKFKLPKIEWKQFGGEIKDWLPFWAQFEKVHKDSDIDPSDKISYLIQATIPGSHARQLVESYPAVKENYEKIVEALTSRFGREDLQIEVYVRELLKLILNNSQSRSKTDLSVLYDKMETQLRALETLGITSTKCAAMLFPLIESCLPENLLRVWQRSTEFKNGQSQTDGVTDIENRLNNLMNFLRSEVQNEQRIALATEAFGLSPMNSRSDTNDRFKKEKQKNIESTRVPTATGLMNCDATRCIFCDGTSHESPNCFKAQKMNPEQRRDMLVKKRACFRCLKQGHQSRKCHSRVKCVVCSKSHVALMCPNLSERKVESVSRIDNKQDATHKNSDKILTNHASAQVFLQTLRLTLINGCRSRQVRALVDSGSQRSYILKSTAQKLGCSPKKVERIVHSLFGGTNSSEQKHQCYDVTINSNDYSCVLEVLDQPIICTEIPPISLGSWINELETLGITMSHLNDAGPIELLLGADVAGKLYTGERRILTSGLVAMETVFGWTLMGKVPSGIRPATSTTMTVLSLFMKDAAITDLWKLDILGITEPTDRKNSEELALAAKEHFLRTITKDVEGRYEVGLPWLEGHPPLPSNYTVAHKRLESITRKLNNDRMFESYDAVFKEWLEEGIIEEVPASENHNPGHYLPHRPVIKMNHTTTKIRPVFDASSREKNQPSLNHCLEKGTNLIELIPTILLRFREQGIGVISDIRKAFLQLSVYEGDRDVLRFLWYDPEGNLKLYRHRRVVFGVCCSPFLLGASIEYHLSECHRRCDLPEVAYSRETVDKLKKCFYVDNCVTSVANEDELHKFMTESRSVMQEGKFDLRGWEFTQDTKPVESLPVLGLRWDTQRDVLMIGKEYIEDMESFRDKKITKRLILSVAQRIFDPIGFTSPATLQPKLLLQQTWEQQLGWDAPVDEEIEKTFRSWVDDLPHLFSIAIPRWICAGPSEADELSLHIFCDASKLAYSAVVFLRVQRNNEVRIHLLAAKARVAPIKKMSIPRLELLAAVIAARLYASVCAGFEFNPQCFFWSDSSSVIAWIRRKDEWSTFVWNRVTEIRKLSPIAGWNHIPGHLNPADLPSRGCTPQYLLRSKWWEGPSWLYASPNLWPKENVSYEEEEIIKERKKTIVATMLDISSDQWHLAYFSKYCQKLRLVAWIFRFLFNLQNPGTKRSGSLTTEEIEGAEVFVLKIVQRQAFSSELSEIITSPLFMMKLALYE